MTYSLTGTTASSTYGRLVQVIHGAPDLYYDGFGNLLDLGAGTVSIGPKGETGSTGSTGANGSSVVWNGDWDSMMIYFPLDMVSYIGNSYICVSSPISSPPYTPPNLDTTNWDLMTQNITGATGSQGETGATGPQGEIGATGSQGEIGPTGPQGEIGATGSQGEIGATGPQGEIGPTGPQGSTGPQGEVGATGSQGEVGATGPQGEIGATGPQGEVGATGPQGVTGPGNASGSFGITIDGSGSAITTGNKGYLTLPYACTINGWQVIGTPTGSCVIDVWKASSGVLPTVANSIAGTEKPTLTNQQINTDLSLSTWTVSVAQYSVFGFNVDSASTVTRVNLTIFITKS